VVEILQRIAFLLSVSVNDNKDVEGGLIILPVIRLNSVLDQELFCLIKLENLQCKSKNLLRYGWIQLFESSFPQKRFQSRSRVAFPSPTAHGKNLCDGIGGTVKRNAYRASHQRYALNQIDTPKKLHEFVVQSMPKIICDFTTEKQHLTHYRRLEKRFVGALPVVGCRFMHSFVPLNQKVLRARAFSLSPDFKDFQLVN
jgi:hypothetical protein